MSAGPGRKTVGGHYLTGFKSVRELATADANVAAVEEVINMELDDNANPVANGTGSLFLYVCSADTITAYKLKLYARPIISDDDEDELDCPWYLMVERDVTNAEAGMTFGFRDMPCVQYKVVFPVITGTGSIALGEQHTV